MVIVPSASPSPPAAVAATGDAGESVSTEPVLIPAPSSFTADAAPKKHKKHKSKSKSDTKKGKKTTKRSSTATQDHDDRTKKKKKKKSHKKKQKALKDEVTTLSSVDQKAPKPAKSSQQQRHGDAPTTAASAAVDQPHKLKKKKKHPPTEGIAGNTTQKASTQTLLSHADEEQEKKANTLALPLVPNDTGTLNSAEETKAGSMVKPTTKTEKKKKTKQSSNTLESTKKKKKKTKQSSNTLESRKEQTIAKERSSLERASSSKAETTRKEQPAATGLSRKDKTTKKKKRQVLSSNTENDRTKMSNGLGSAAAIPKEKTPSPREALTSHTNRPNKHKDSTKLLRSSKQQPETEKRHQLSKAASLASSSTMSKLKMSTTTAMNHLHQDDTSTTYQGDDEASWSSFDPLGRVTALPNQLEPKKILHQSNVGLGNTKLHENQHLGPPEFSNRTTSAGSRDSVASSVSFGTVSIHSHQVILGDNPSVSRGVPLTLSWKSFASQTVDLDAYESYYEQGTVQRRRTYAELRIPQGRREQAIRESGEEYDKNRVRKVLREIDFIRQSSTASEIASLASSDSGSSRTTSYQAPLLIRVLRRWGQRRRERRLAKKQRGLEKDGLVPSVIAYQIDC